MKTFLTTAALVAALAMPALAQEAGTENRGNPAGNTQASDKEKGPTGSMATKGSGKVTATDDKKDAATNAQAGTTGAGEAGQNMKSTTGSGMKTPTDKMSPATNTQAGETGAGEANQKK